MLDGPGVVSAFRECGITHVVWVPDSELGTWEKALCEEPTIRLVRVCREGEAFAVAAGLLLGGKRPVVAIQCTGLFESGDSLRNFVHDLKLPLFIVVGVRGYLAHQKKATADTCPVFTLPIVQAWELNWQLLSADAGGEDLVRTYRSLQRPPRAGVVLIPE